MRESIFSPSVPHSFFLLIQLSALVPGLIETFTECFLDWISERERGRKDIYAKRQTDIEKERLISLTCL